MTSNFRFALCTAAIATVAAMQPARADDDRFSFHGFGNQDYWKSSQNSVDQSGNGTFENNFIGIVGSAKISDDSKLWAQIQDSSTENVRFTWMFVDYQVNDNLRFQVGRVKFPFGIYNEYIDTRALQVTATKPLAYALEADMGYDAYNGFGVAYDMDLAKAGRLSFQGFFGDIYTPDAPIYTPPYSQYFQMGNLEAITDDHHVVGGKITWETPVDGLRLLVSANQTNVVTTADNGQIPNQLGKENRLMLSVDFVRDNLDLKSEYNYHRYPGLTGFADEKSDAWYIQGGYNIGAWMPYGRFDDLVTDKSQSSNPAYYQRTLVVGINRKITQNLNFRVEEQFNHGYAMPAAAGETVPGLGKDSWELFVAQINFMF